MIRYLVLSCAHRLIPARLILARPLRRSRLSPAREHSP